MKKAAIIIVLAFVLPLCLFADKWFTLTHTMLIPPGTGYVQFWEPDGTSIADNISGSTVSITESPMVFSRLGLHFTGCFQMSLSLGYTELKNTSDSSLTYPFTLSVLNPDEDTSFSLVGSAYSQTISNINFTMLDLYNGVLVGSDRQEGSISIADLKITLISDDVAPGTYEGTFILVLTEGNT